MVAQNVHNQIPSPLLGPERLDMGQVRAEAAHADWQHQPHQRHSFESLHGSPWHPMAHTTIAPSTEISTN